MEVVEKILNECRTLAQSEEQLRQELSNLKTQLSIEEQNLAISQKACEHMSSQCSNLNNLISSRKEQIESLRGFRESFIKSSLIYSFMDSFVLESDPSEEQQIAQVKLVQENYKKLLEGYEKVPQYQEILDAEIKDRELAKLIEVKQNELMRLETEREF